MVKNKLVIVSPETEEERKDMLMLVKDWEVKYIEYKRFFNYKYRYLTKIIDVFLFLFFVIKNSQGKNTIILGSPCLRNRIVVFFCSKKYVMYLRNIHVGNNELTSLSDKLGYFFKRVKINNILTNPYCADIHLVTSSLTVNFLKYRNADKKIIDMGAIWLNNIKVKKNSYKLPKIYFLTQAFSEHNYHEAQKEQVEFVEKLSVFLNEHNIPLIIKKHPRDLGKYLGHTLFNGNATDFLHEVSENDIVISLFSTLGFELSSIGANVKFISFPSLKSVYDIRYDEYHIPFRISDAIDLENLISSNKVEISIFSRIKFVGRNEIF